jgi:urease subunit gamma/beta
MRLSPQERDRLLLFSAAELARRRLGRGLRLNVPEATAIIADTVCEEARAGATLTEAIEAARGALTPDDVLPGVVEIVTEVQVEAVFDDGTRLAVVRSPISGDALPAGGADADTETAPDRAEYPDAVSLEVSNTATVPIAITSHAHFLEVNRKLRFDRAAAYGRRLAVPAGTVVHFPAGATRVVHLTPIRGARVCIGFAGFVDGPLDAPGAREEALARVHASGYLDAGASDAP